MKRSLAIALLAAGLLAGCTKEQQEAPSKAVTGIEDRTRSEVTELNNREQQLEEQVEP